MIVQFECRAGHVTSAKARCGENHIKCPRCPGSNRGPMGGVGTRALKRTREKYNGALATLAKE